MIWQMNDGYAERLQQLDRVYFRSDGRKLIYFGGCDYLRLSSHPSVLKAVHRGLERCGLSTSASRTTTGNHRVYGEIEHRAAEFFESPRAVLTSSGYLANVAVVQ